MCRARALVGNASAQKLPRPQQTLQCRTVEMKKEKIKKKTTEIFKEMIKEILLHKLTRLQQTLQSRFVLDRAPTVVINKK